MKNRKDEHIKYALKYKSKYNSFDDIELIHSSLPKYNLQEIDISTEFAGKKYEYPFFINAMTGGSEISKEINRKLARIASECGILFVTGSYSPILKNPEDDSFIIIKKENPEILLGTNIGIDKSYKDAKRAVDDLNPLFLQVHINLMQELIMSEGSRNFKEWENNLKDMIKYLNIPIILKEVGFGMDIKTLEKGIELGIKTFDISGKGGTNFAYIENSRNYIKNRFRYLEEWGQSTVVTLIQAKKYSDKVEILASGGVRHPLDIIKSLVLGAKASGISGKILELINNYSVEDVIDIINNWKEECKIIMCGLNCKNIEELKKIEYVVYGKVKDFFIK